MAGLDYGIIALYLCLIVWLGSSFAKRQTTAYEYFLISRTVPWWAVCFTVVATETSTLTFVGIPAETFHQGTAGYAGNMTFLQLAIGYVIGRFIISGLFIPKYFSRQLLTSYEVLHERFGPTVRNLSSAMFLVTRSAGDGIRLFATSAVVGAILGVPVWIAILVLGAAMIVYTFYGGAAAVIWTDVIQMFVYLAGALVVAYFAVAGVAGGFGAVMDYGAATGRFVMFDFRLDFFRAYTFWAGLVGGLTLTLATHGTDQFLVQRLLAARSKRDAQVGLSLSGVLVFLQFMLFLFIGVALAAFYAQHGAPTLARPDLIVPAFVGNELPDGLTGLVVAAIVAAALSPSINALAATTVNDFYLPYWNPAAPDAVMLAVAKRATIVWGLVQIGIALLATQLTRSILSAGLSVLGLGAGPVLGAFLIAALRVRAPAPQVAAAMVLAWAVVVNVYWWTPIAWPWYSTIGAATTFVVSVLPVRRSVPAVLMVLVAVLVPFGGVACGRGDPPPAAAGEGAVEVTVQPARLNVLRLTVAARGVVAPLPDADWTISATETSRIADLPIAEGEPVKTGDVLVRFEVASRVAAIHAAELEIAQGGSTVEGARARVKQLQSLFEKGLTARIELDTAKRDLAAAEAALIEANALLAATRAADERATIRARFPGVVLKRWHTEGDLVHGSMTDPVIRVADPSRVHITLDVPVQEAGRLIPGQLATAVVLGEATLQAKVAAIVPSTALEATTVEVRLTLSSPATLIVGTPVQVEILIAEVTEALVVPSGAVLRAGGAPYVLIATTDGRAARRDVKLGLATRELTQILEGLTIGEFVIVTNHANLNDGDVVTIVRF